MREPEGLLKALQAARRYGEVYAHIERSFACFPALANGIPGC